MKNLKEKLTEIITAKSDVLQFTKDRRFEEAWIIPINKSRPTKEEIDIYLNKEKFQTLIVEYVWGSQNDDNRFVITIFLDKKCLLQDPKQFIDICLNNYYQYVNFKSLINSFDNEVIGHPYLLNDPVDSINLSVFNHWLSVGPVDLWNKNDIYNFEKIKSKIKSRPEIERTSLNYQELFFRFNIDSKFNGPYYGIKTPCCNKIDDEWVVDFKKVDYWIKLMLGL